MEMKLCEDCPRRAWCVTPCARLNDILFEDRVMEKHTSDKVILYPKKHEIRFCELAPQQKNTFSTDDVVPWNTEKLRFRKTTVFIERFFNKTPCKDLAEKFGVEENTIVCVYKQAVEHIDKIIKALDSRREGLKATKKSKFKDDEKYFLLVSIFGFSQAEVARMFGKNHDIVNKKVKRMTDSFGAAFSGLEVKEEIPVVDPPMGEKLKRADVIRLVEGYTDQGLTHKQAFLRIAGRYEDIVGRPVNYRSVESKYYKAMAAA
jgi:hypothetical protein